MPVLIDGNNLLHQLETKNASRTDVRRAVLDACRHERMRVTVVFDGPPPAGTPTRELLGSVTVLYAGSSSADDVIVRQLPRGVEARNWVVVTDDRELRGRATQWGAQVRGLREWQAKPRRPAPRARPEPKLSSHDIAEWEAYFAGEGEDDE